MGSRSVRWLAYAAVVTLAACTPPPPLPADAGGAAAPDRAGSHVPSTEDASSGPVSDAGSGAGSGGNGSPGRSRRAHVTSVDVPLPGRYVYQVTETDQDGSIDRYQDVYVYKRPTTVGASTRMEKHWWRRDMRVSIDVVEWSADGVVVVSHESPTTVYSNDGVSYERKPPCTYTPPFPNLQMPLRSGSSWMARPDCRDPGEAADPDPAVFRWTVGTLDTVAVDGVDRSCVWVLEHIENAPGINRDSTSRCYSPDLGVSIRGEMETFAGTLVESVLASHPTA